MPADKTREPTDREKQEAHGAQGEQGDRPLKTRDAKREPTVYEGAEESNQQRR